MKTMEQWKHIFSSLCHHNDGLAHLQYVNHQISFWSPTIHVIHCVEQQAEMAGFLQEPTPKAFASENETIKSITVIS